MNITIYQCKDDRRKLNKTLSAARSYNVSLKDDTSAVNPTLILSQPLPPNYNYCYIPTFKRYYFITDSRVLIAKQYEISLACDVLMSFAATIKDSPVILRRSSNLGNKLIPDNIPLLSQRQYIYKNFKGGDLDVFGSDKVDINTHNYLLTTL